MYFGATRMPLANAPPTEAPKLTKAVERMLPVHEAQLLTYLRLSDCRVGLLINFNTVSLTDGIKRRVL